MEHQRSQGAPITNDDLRQDRRLIMKKIQRHRRQNLRNSGQSGEDDRRGADFEGQGLSGELNTDDEFVILDDIIECGIENDNVEDKYGSCVAIDTVLQAVKAAHEQDEELIGGRDGNERSEAMNQALSSPPTSWWNMRKQWRKRLSSNNNRRRVGVLGRGEDGTAGNVSRRSRAESGSDTIIDHCPDTEYDVKIRTGRRVLQATSPDAGMVAHPVMLTDPQSMGYDTTSFRQYSLASGHQNIKNSAKKRINCTSSILVVSQTTIQKRKLQQATYILASVCVLFLFVFFLEQRKLLHYASTESAISLSSYLTSGKVVPEGMNAVSGTLLDDESEHSMIDSMGLNVELKSQSQPHPIRQHDKTGFRHPNSSIPLKQEMTLFAGNDTESSSFRSSDRFLIIQGLIVEAGITEIEVFKSSFTPQYHALNWMAYQDQFDISSDNENHISKIIQRYSLAVLYYATNGPSWTNQLDFLSNTDECAWNDVFGGYFIGAGNCDGGFITALVMWNNNLVGFLPPEIGALSSLRSLSVFDNSLRGPLPRSMEKLKSLNLLYLHKNQFRGSLDYLCANSIENLKADCEGSGNVSCTCCSSCCCGANEEE